MTPSTLTQYTERLGRNLRHMMNDPFRKDIGFAARMFGYSTIVGLVVLAAYLVAAVIFLAR